ncbi:MAG: hypothetical protein FWH06_02765, partial [Oscillospiraceae bacterium]|nr:hypothetical protein [Oscillospiraceae bacterium]
MSHHENNHHKDAAPQHQMERYSYSFEPAEPAPVRIKKRRPALKAAAFIMCGLALSLGGGF